MVGQSLVDAEELKALIIQSLQRQGFEIKGNWLAPFCDQNKKTLRNLHAEAVQYRVERSAEGLRRHESRLLTYIAPGHDVVPTLIAPQLVEVRRDSEEELLFRYASLHWSIPVSSGYGRRLRFLVMDGQNEKLIGLIGLGDPVFSLGPRDSWVGWSKQDRGERLRYVLDAFVLGAVPPYSYLLCGKLVAMLAASDEVREAFGRKYSNGTSIISKRNVTGTLAMLTTNSALGRSSIYNRLKFQKRLLFQPVGFTSGSGDFHFSNGLYKDIRNYCEAHCLPTAKKASWGTGFRNRREIIRKVLGHLGLSLDWQYHGVRRQIFVIPLAGNTKEFLGGSDSYLDAYVQPVSELFSSFRERWLLPRSQWDGTYRSFDPDSYTIWSRTRQESLPESVEPGR